MSPHSAFEINPMIDNCLETFELRLSRRSQDLKERRQGMARAGPQHQRVRHPNSLTKHPKKRHAPKQKHYLPNATSNHKHFVDNADYGESHRRPHTLGDDSNPRLIVAPWPFSKKCLTGIKRASGQFQGGYHTSITQITIET
jgi:hypothetical protein